MIGGIGLFKRREEKRREKREERREKGEGRREKGEERREKREEGREKREETCTCNTVELHTSSHALIPHCSTSQVSSGFDLCEFHNSVESELLSDSMPKILSVDPLFQRAYETLSKEAQRNLRETGLLDPAVLVCYLEGPDTEIEELAREPGDNEKLRELLRQVRRAARGQRAEFARRGLDEFVRRDRERKEEARAHETEGPSELQRAAEAPPPWHCRRLPSRLARNTKLEGDSRAREKAEEEERQRWVNEVTDLLITLTGTPTADRAARTTDPKLSAARMCAKVRAATVRSYVRAWRPLWRWWTGTGNNGLPSSPEAVLTYLEQRASEPCAPSVLRRTRCSLGLLRRSCRPTLVSQSQQMPLVREAIRRTGSNALRDQERPSLADTLRVHRGSGSFVGRQSGRNGVALLRFLATP